MSDPRPAGPFSEIPISGGSTAALYLIPFDKDGRCLGPATLEHMQQAAASGRFTDVHLYSHGWNNVFPEAVAHYTEFFTEYFALRDQAGLGAADYRPLLVGIIWPSTALVSEDEEAPRFAATAPPSARAAALESERVARAELSVALRDENDRQRFLELADRERISRDEALELARILLPIIQREAADREGVPQATSAEKLVKAWEQAQGGGASASDGKPGRIADDDDTADAAPARPAGILGFLDPRNIIRTATVFQMKDRAGTVGAHGVGPMLRDLLTGSEARVHLTGHSYGAKVMLSALSLVNHPRKVHSVLLLQPAVNAFCFAPSIRENDGQPGGYREALERTERPILSTFSNQDAPLTKFFHNALRRDGDLGEIRPAAGPPSLFAALGGFGPGGMAEGESRTIPILGPPEKYDFSDRDIRLYALDGSGRITGHGDVRNAFTEWALVNLVSAGV